MSDETLRFVLQVGAIFLGGGSVQLSIFLLRRKSEIRGLDTASDATALNSANAFIGTLQADAQAQRGDVALIKGELATLKLSWQAERNSFTQQLQIASDENARLAGMIAKLRVDLDIANRQIDDLRRRYPI